MSRKKPINYLFKKNAMQSKDVEIISVKDGFRIK